MGERTSASALRNEGIDQQSKQIQPLPGGREQRLLGGGVERFCWHDVARRGLHRRRWVADQQSRLLRRRPKFNEGNIPRGRVQNCCARSLTCMALHLRTNHPWDSLFVSDTKFFAF